MRIDELAVLDLRQHDLAPDAERHIGGKPSCPPHAFGDSVLEPPGELPDRVATGRFCRERRRTVEGALLTLLEPHHRRIAGGPPVTAFRPDSKVCFHAVLRTGKDHPVTDFWGFSDCLTFRQKALVKDIVGILPQAANKHQRSYQQISRMSPLASKPLWTNEALKPIEKPRLSRVPSSKLDYVG